MGYDRMVDWIPQKAPPEDHSYTAKQVVSYIMEAYGTKVKESEVSLGLSCGQEALEKLGFEHEEGDEWFSPDPRIPAPKFAIGVHVVTKNGGVGLVKDNENGSYYLLEVPGWKHPKYSAWWCEIDLKQINLKDYTNA